MKIKSVKINNDEQLDFGDFNVFIGGNGVGKTTFLMELYSKATETQRLKYYWITDIPQYETVDLRKDMTLLKGSLTRRTDQNGRFFYSQSAKDINGNVEVTDPLRFSLADVDQIDTYSDPEI